MKIDIGESLVNSYLRHIKDCHIVQQNWKPSGNWFVEDEWLKMATAEFDRIQRHKAFTEIFKTGFEHTIRQTELDALGLGPDNTIYAANVIFHDFGINFGSKTDTRNRVIKNLLRAHLALNCFFPEYRHVLIFFAPKVVSSTDEIIREYFSILERDFSTEQTSFIYLSNNQFRDEVLMQTLERVPDEFDTNELFIRSFKLLTAYAADVREEEVRAPSNTGNKTKEARKKTVAKEPAVATVPAGSEKLLSGDEDIVNGELEAEQEKEQESSFLSDNEKTTSEISKVISRVPKWFSRPGQNNSKILIRYMNMLEKSEQVSFQQLAEECADVKNFSGNFAQMNNVAEKNHGKVFTGSSDNIQLWEPIKDFVIQEYINFKKSYYSS